MNRLNKIKTHLKTTLPISIACLIVIILQFSAPADDEIPLSFSASPNLPDRIDLSPSDYPIAITAYGQAFAAVETQLRSQATGRINRISNKLVPGAFVTEGTVLLEIEDVSYKEQVALAEQSLAQAKLEYEREKALSLQAQEDLEDETLAPASNLALRKPQLSLAKKRLNAATAKVASAKMALSNTQVTAPYDAYIVSRHVNVGDLAQYGDLLIHLFSGDQVHIHAKLSNSDVQQIQTVLNSATSGEKESKPENHLTFSAQLLSTNGVSATSFPLTLLQWGESRDSKSQIQTAVLGAKNWLTGGGLAIKPGVMTQVSIGLGELHNVYQIPNRYVQEDTVTLVREDHQLTERAVDVLLRTATHVIGTIESADATVTVTPQRPMTAALATANPLVSQNTKSN